MTALVQRGQDPQPLPAGTAASVDHHDPGVTPRGDEPGGVRAERPRHVDVVEGQATGAGVRVERPGVEDHGGAGGRDGAVEQRADHLTAAGRGDRAEHREAVFPAEAPHAGLQR